MQCDGISLLASSRRSVEHSHGIMTGENTVRCLQLVPVVMRYSKNSTEYPMRSCSCSILPSLMVVRQHLPLHPCTKMDGFLDLVAVVGKRGQGVCGLCGVESSYGMRRDEKYEEASCECGVLLSTRGRGLGGDGMRVPQTRRVTAIHTFAHYRFCPDAKCRWCQYSIQTPSGGASRKPSGRPSWRRPRSSQGRDRTKIAEMFANERFSQVALVFSYADKGGGLG